MRYLFCLVSFLLIFNGCVNLQKQKEARLAKAMDKIRGQHIQVLLDQVKRYPDEIVKLPTGRYLYKWVESGKVSFTTQKPIIGSHLFPTTTQVERTPDCVKWIETDQNHIILGGRYDGCAIR